MLSYSNMLSHPDQGPIQGDQEILYLVSNSDFPSLRFHSISSPPVVIQLLPQGPVLWPQSIASLAPEDQGIPGLFLCPAQVAQHAFIPKYPPPLRHISLTYPQVHQEQR